MEGIAGVVTAHQLFPSGFEYERFRRFMTDEALAAVRAAKQAGSTEIVVSDSHGNGENLLIELFPNDVRIVRSWPRHGGALTDYTIATDGRFRAAVSGAGEVNQIAMYGSDECAVQSNDELGVPWKNTAL